MKITELIQACHLVATRDLAKLYQVETRIINQTVKRNIERFPEEFCFRLTNEEMDSLRSQFVISKTRGGNRYLPYVFTEQGVAMISVLLKSDIAIAVSIKIMNAFVAMKKYISNNLLTLNNHSNMLIDHEERIKILESTFSKFDSFSNELFFEGQIYDAHSLLLDIFNSSKKSIVIIDNYISKELLDVLSKTNKQVTIHTKNIDTNLINKYQSQYHNVIVKTNKSFHDRFIIIDNKDLYHCGASFKDLGKKCFAINKINNIEMIKEIQNKL